jgi:hypothetical protein
MSAFWEKILRERGLSEPGLVVAGTWDSSWFASPSGGSRYHICDDDGAPMCNRHRALIAEFTVMPATEVPTVVRCRRSGCRQRWPDA